MNISDKHVAMAALQLALGIIVGIESALFAFSASTSRHLANLGFPAWTGAVIGVSELVAALLFLLPISKRAGGYALLAIFAIAIVLHVLHGEYNVGPLAIYAAAVWAVMADGKRAARRTTV